MKEFIKKNIKLAVVVPVLAFTLGMVSPLTASAADTSCSAGSYTLQNGANCAKTADQSSTLFGDGGIFTTIVNVMLFLVGTLSVIMLIYGGVRYVLSSGDAGHVNNAKNTILYAIVGLVISILAYAIVNFVIGSIAGGNSSN